MNAHDISTTDSGDALKDGEMWLLVNRCGSTGKSTMAKHLQSVFPSGTKLISIDGVNSSDAVADKEASGAKFMAVAVHITSAELSESFIVDVGASQWPVVSEKLAQSGNLLKSITRFLLPCIARKKEILDTIETIKDLLKMRGVKKDRISVVFNMVERLEDVAFDFQELIEFCEAEGVEILPTAIAKSDAYTYLRGQDRTIFDVDAKAVDMDWRAERRAASGNQERMADIAFESSLEDLCVMAADNMRSVFAQKLSA